MEIIALIVVLFVIAGVVLAIRERRTGRGTILDERPQAHPQTEADRERIRAEGNTVSRHSFGGHSGDSDMHQ